MLVGIISRGDLVRVLSQTSRSVTAPRSDNATLQREIYQEILKQRWLDSGFVNITVTNGAVDIWGTVASADQHAALLVLVTEIAGNAVVKDHVTVGALNFPGWV